MALPASIMSNKRTKMMAAGAAAVALCCCFVHVYRHWQQRQKRTLERARRRKNRNAFEQSVPQVPDIKKKGFSREELAQYNGIEKPEIFVSVKGDVFQVAHQFYGPGENYHCFAGTEASRNLAKGIIGKDEADCDWRVNLSEDHKETLDEWAHRFAAKYPVVGWFEPDEEYTQRAMKFAP